MFNKLKYIIVADDRPYLFSELDQHIDIALRLGYHQQEVLGAGFVIHTSERLKCFGKSISLGVESRPQDSDIINRFLGLDN